MQSEKGQPWAKHKASSEREGKKKDWLLRILTLPWWSSDSHHQFGPFCIHNVKFPSFFFFWSKINLLCWIWLWTFIELCLWAHHGDGFVLLPSTMGAVSHSRSANTAISSSQGGSIHKHKTLLYFLHAATTVAQQNDHEFDKIKMINMKSKDSEWVPPAAAELMAECHWGCVGVEPQEQHRPTTGSTQDWDQVGSQWDVCGALGVPRQLVNYIRLWVNDLLHRVASDSSKNLP